MNLSKNGFRVSQNTWFPYLEDALLIYENKLNGDNSEYYDRLKYLFFIIGFYEELLNRLYAITHYTKPQKAYLPTADYFMSMTLHGKCMLLHDVGLINRRCLSSSKDINQTRNEVFHFSPIYVVINGGEEVDHSTLNKKLEMKSIKSTTHKIFRVLDSLEKKIGDIDAREAENDTKAIDLLFRGVTNNEKNESANILHHKYKKYLENPLRVME